MLNQESEQEWLARRVGKITASKISDMLAKTKTGWGAGRKNYLAQLAAERLTGTKADGYTNAAMQHGIDTEPEALAAYEFYRDAECAGADFVDHPTIPMSGASPDALVGDDGLVEVKCPNTATHIDYLLSRKIPTQYQLQMTWQLACTERTWCDWVSYDPRMPEDMRMLVIRFEPEPGAIEEMEREVVAFNAEVEKTISELQKATSARA